MSYPFTFLFIPWTYDIAYNMICESFDLIGIFGLFGLKSMQKKHHSDKESSSLWNDAGFQGNTFFIILKV